MESIKQRDRWIVVIPAVPPRVERIYQCPLLDAVRYAQYAWHPEARVVAWRDASPELRRRAMLAPITLLGAYVAQALQDLLRDPRRRPDYAHVRNKRNKPLVHSAGGGGV